jgi:2,3-bisphosphoglycerate-dependent phosphoglycerate mutase
MIVVVRHGETAFNAARILQPPEVPLNERGSAQAQRAATRIAALGGSALVSSDLLRAQMTATAIAEATGLPIELEPLLQERNFGALRGLRYDDIGTDFWKPDYLPPEGENVAMFDARVARAWRVVVERAAASKGNLIVVTHGMVCASIARQFLALDPALPAPTRWGNTSITLCEPVAPHRVHVLNCVEHLANSDDARDGSAPSGL